MSILRLYSQCHRSLKSTTVVALHSKHTSNLAKRQGIFLSLAACVFIPRRNDYGAESELSLTVELELQSENLTQRRVGVRGGGLH